MNGNRTESERISWIVAEVSSMIAKETGMSQMDSFFLFSHSKTHAMLLDNSMEMWFSSPKRFLRSIIPRLIPEIRGILHTFRRHETWIVHSYFSSI